jgi:hypothetical protein
MNDIAIARSEIGRIDWPYLAHLVRTQGVLMDSAVITPDNIEHNLHRQMDHAQVDRRRRVIQRFTIQLVEEAMPEETKEAIQIVP